MNAIEVWLLGGPADGRSQLIELTDGRLPELVRLPQTGYNIGSSDQPAPPVTHNYRRAGDVDDQPVYWYDGRT